MAKQTNSLTKDLAISVYEKTYSALKKKDFDSFCSLMSFEKGRGPTKKDWTKENIENMLQIFPTPEGMKILGSLIDYPEVSGFMFVTNLPDGPKGVFGTLFFKKTSKGYQLTKISSMVFLSDDNKPLSEKEAISKMSQDGYFWPDKNPRIFTPKPPAGVIELKNGYLEDEFAAKRGPKPPRLLLSNVPLEWVDSAATGNWSLGELNFDVIGGLMYQNPKGEKGWSEEQILFHYAPSKMSISECAQMLKKDGFEIKTKSDSFVATKKDDFFGSSYIVVKKAQGGFLMVRCKGKNVKKSSNIIDALLSKAKLIL